MPSLEVATAPRGLGPAAPESILRHPPGDGEAGLCTSQGKQGYIRSSSTKPSFLHAACIQTPPRASSPCPYLPSLELLGEVQFLLNGIQQLAVQRHHVHLAFGEF